MGKFAVGIEYAGTAYSGWQRQKHALSIQQHVEEAIGYVANHRVQLVCAGRTDAGVHAIEQVAHFESTAKRDNRSWILGSNCQLPSDIRIKWIIPVEGDFHARFSAIARSYRYIIINVAVPSALFHDRAGWEFRPLDQVLMHEAAQILVGEHDFSAFRAAGCQAKSSTRRIHEISVERRGDLLFLDVRANAFLYHMVRNIVGSLMSVGQGERSTDWFKRVFAGGDRNLAAATAPAAGLYLLRAHYPDAFKLPSNGKKPVLF
ncbi:MAG: tRNA pseudouridine(38-40) synthase TruA [Gammaproteobacteria bacterium]|nr:MAG: tRNA pseudouridine(38-40) synthase TruA [Gammaproteobacteria bacterium]